jgi:hypothetical protein
VRAYRRCQEGGGMTEPVTIERLDHAIAVTAYIAGKVAA